MEYYAAVEKDLMMDYSECYPATTCGHEHRSILAASNCVCWPLPDVARLDTDNYDFLIINRVEIKRAQAMAQGRKKVRAKKLFRVCAVCHSTKNLNLVACEPGAFGDYEWCCWSCRPQGYGMGPDHVQDLIWREWRRTSTTIT